SSAITVNVLVVGEWWTDVFSAKICRGISASRKYTPKATPRDTTATIMTTVLSTYQMITNS
ncbi:MAG: hypothetical protein HKP31_06605, partial [Nitrosopumilus sp.]|nr:hypothetical protein [Nitrosopumilus sp.]